MAKIFEMRIEKLSFGGDGIGRHEDLVYFVPFSAPGDRLKVQETERKKNFGRAEILEILESGPERISAPCPVFGQCGGCTWQHVSYNEQLRQKQQIIEEQLKRVLKPETIVNQIIPSPNPFRYRNRIQLKFDGKKLGFFARQSHQIVDINDCPISEEVLAREIPRLKTELSQKGSGPIAKIELLRTPDQKVETSFEDSPYEGVGFSQVNSDQNEKLVQTVLSWMKESSTNMIYDLYAGAGNFTFPLREAFPQAGLEAVELSEKSVQAANQQIKDRKLSPSQIRFYLSDVELFLKRNLLKEGSWVLLDPPRAGCSENSIQSLAHQKVRKIFYVSCNPASLARDLSRLQAIRPWKIRRIQPFDMFPQTDHVETLVELEIDSQ